MYFNGFVQQQLACSCLLLIIKQFCSIMLCSQTASNTKPCHVPAPSSSIARALSPALRLFTSAHGESKGEAALRLATFIPPEGGAAQLPERPRCLGLPSQRDVPAPGSPARRRDNPRSPTRGEVGTGRSHSWCPPTARILPAAGSTGGRGRHSRPCRRLRGPAPRLRPTAAHS